MTDGYSYPEISLHAKPSNKNASIITAASIISAAACIGVCFFIERYKGIFGILAMIFFTVAIVFYTKYTAAEYIYDLSTDGEGYPLFIVRSRTGNRITTHLRLDLYSIRRVERLSQAELKGRKTDTGVLKYTYTPSFLPCEVVLLTVRSRYERADVVIEAPTEFSALLAENAKRAAEQFTESEEAE